MKLWIDADACPRVIKEIIFRASERLTIPVLLVANKSLAKHHSQLVASVVVPEGFDMADDYIADQVAPEDLVIIPRTTLLNGHKAPMAFRPQNFGCHRKGIEKSRKTSSYFLIRGRISGVGRF